MATTTTIPADLIGLAEAAQLLPSRKPGRKLHVTSLYRWIADGKLRGWRIGGHYFVSRADVLALPELAVASVGLVSAGQRRGEIEAARARLEVENR